jgi:serine phosphatase RsbU (regulator of sigma subunit)
LLLGLSQNGEYNNIKIDTEADDEFYMFTDGIVESRNDEGMQFGLDAIKETIKTKQNGSDGIESIRNKFSDYTNNNFEDDITLMKIKVL